jgi:hypothetical protein
MGDLSDFEREQIIGVCLAGVSVTKTVTLLHISRATIPKVMSAYTDHGKNNICGEEEWTKVSIDRKRSSYIEKDCSEQSQNYCSRGDSRTQYST